MDNKRPFDLKKLDFDTRRKEKRKKLLFFSAVPAVLLIAIGLWFAVPSVLTLQAASSFEKAQYDMASSRVSALSFANLIEPHKALYNQGTTLSAKGEHAAAVHKFEEALAYTQDEDTICVITYNLVLTLEGSGDAAVIKNDINAAITGYKKALNTLDATANCFPDPELRQRIEDKLKAAEEAQKRNGSSQSGNEEESEEISDNDSKQQQLRDAEGEAAQDRQDGTFERYDYDQVPDGVKPW
jgi:tetratricopeptide (TPR) repeat protein